MPEQSLHNQLKKWYSKPSDRLEEVVEGFIVDIVRGDLLVEVQTGNFSTIRDKLGKLLKTRNLRLVHPVPERKWITKIDGEKVTRRASPMRGRLEKIFNELIYIPSLPANPRFSMEVLLVHMEETLVNDGLGSWRRRRWSVQDRKLLSVLSSLLFKKPEDYLSLLPETLQRSFTSRNLSKASNLSPSLARKMVYCLSRIGVIEQEGKHGRSKSYKLSK